MDEIYDVIISGGGPSGSLLGFLLSSKNINTLIIEKEIFPRYKTCAGGIAHRILKILRGGRTYKDVLDKLKIIKY